MCLVASLMVSCSGSYAAESGTTHILTQKSLQYPEGIVQKKQSIQDHQQYLCVKKVRIGDTVILQLPVCDEYTVKHIWTSGEDHIEFLGSENITKNIDGTPMPYEAYKYKIISAPKNKYDELGINYWVCPELTGKEEYVVNYELIVVG